MKIVFFVKSAGLMRYYVNAVHEHFPVARIVEERRPTPPQTPLIARVIHKGPTGIARSVVNRVRRAFPNEEAFRRQKRAQEVNAILGAKAKSFPVDVPITSVDDINGPTVHAILQQERPDVILVQGTSIVRDATLPTDVFNFNMHAGLSPYYRGSSSTMWALVNWDPYNIGVTLHRLTERADAGPIIAQRRVVPTADDTSHSIELKLTREGAELSVKVLERFARGEPIHEHRQDLSVGRCYVGRHWQPELTAWIDRIDRQGLVAQMLANPSTRIRRPIVEW